MARKDKFLQKALPDKMFEPPTIQMGLEIYMTAFNELTTTRLVEGGMVPWDKIEEYADRHRFSMETREDLRWHVRQLDIEYLAWLRKKNPDKSHRGLKDKSSKKPPATRRKR